MAELTEALQKSDVAFAVRYNKIRVKDFESFRRALPTEAKLVVAKNTLIKQAVSRVSRCANCLSLAPTADKLLMCSILVSPCNVWQDRPNPMCTWADCMPGLRSRWQTGWSSNAWDSEDVSVAMCLC